MTLQSLPSKSSSSAASSPAVSPSISANFLYPPPAASHSDKLALLKLWKKDFDLKMKFKFATSPAPEAKSSQKLPASPDPVEPKVSSSRFNSSSIVSSSDSQGAGAHNSAVDIVISPASEDFSSSVVDAYDDQKPLLPRFDVESPLVLMAPHHLTFSTPPARTLALRRKHRMRKQIRSIEGAMSAPTSPLLPKASGYGALPIEDEVDIPDTTSEDERQGNKIVVLACILVLILGIPATSVYSFLPRYAIEYGASQNMLGAIFASHSIAVLISAYLFGRNASKVGTKAMIVGGLGVVSFASGLSALTNGLTGNYFVITLMALRFLQGAGTACAQTGITVAVTILNESHTATSIAWVDFFESLACVVGPLVGGFLAEYGGFRMPFAVIAGLAAVTAVPFNFLVPNVEIEEEEEHVVEFSASSMLWNKKVFLILLGCVFGLGSYAFVDSNLGLRFEELGLSQSVAGIALSGFSFCYAIPTPLFSRIYLRIGRTALLVPSAVASCVGLLLVGGTFNGLLATLSIREIDIVFMGMALVGVGTAGLVVPVVPELIRVGKSESKNSESVVGLAISSYSLGDILGPITGSLLLSFGSFGLACLIVAVGMISLIGVNMISSVPICRKVCTDEDEVSV